MSTKSSVPDERASGEEPDHSSLTLFPGETVDLIAYANSYQPMGHQTIGTGCSCADWACDGKTRSIA